MTGKNVEIFGRTSAGVGTPVLVDTSGNLQVEVLAGTAVLGATQDGGPSWTSSYTYTTSADMTTAADLTAAPGAGLKLVVTDIIFSTDTAMSFTFQEETSGTVIGKVYAAANSTVQITPRSKWKLPVAVKKLQGDASVAGNVAVTVFYYTEA